MQINGSGIVCSGMERRASLGRHKLKENRAEQMLGVPNYAFAKFTSDDLAGRVLEAADRHGRRVNPNSEVDSKGERGARPSARFTLRPSTVCARTKIFGH